MLSIMNVTTSYHCLNDYIVCIYVIAYDNMSHLTTYNAHHTSVITPVMICVMTYVISVSAK